MSFEKRKKGQRNDFERKLLIQILTVTVILNGLVPHSGGIWPGFSVLITLKEAANKVLLMFGSQG
jgi:hypothetical protein